MHKLIVIEGLDGSGKATQAAILQDLLLQKRFDATAISFPNYDSPASGAIKMYLAGDFGANPEDVNAYAASAFYAVDRFATWNKELKNIKNGNKVFVADRYTSSNAIHQCAKLPSGEWDAYLAWLENFEFGLLQIPKPNMVLYLDVDVEISQQLMLSRYKQEEHRKDIHERNIQYLEKCRKAALYCAKKLNWQWVNCCRDKKMLSKEEISKNIIDKTMEVL